MSDDLRVPAANVSLVIFGFEADATAEDVASVLRCCGVPLRDVWADLAVEMVRIPGSRGETYAHVQHVPDRLLAYRLSDGVNARRFQGRHLQSWVPVMAWS